MKQPKEDRGKSAEQMAREGGQREADAYKSMGRATAKAKTRKAKRSGR
jgi:hypothetical protein